MDDQNHVVFVGRYISRVNVLLHYNTRWYIIVLYILGTYICAWESVTLEVHKLWYPKKKMMIPQ